MSAITLHQSSIHLLRRCARRYYYEYELDGVGREPVQVPWTAADFGTTMHRGLATWHTIGGLPLALDALDAQGIGHDGRPFGPPRDPHERAACRALLRAYATHWGEEDAATFVPLGAELYFAADALRTSGKLARGAQCKECCGSGIRQVGAPVPPNWKGWTCPACHGRGHTGPRIEGTVDLVTKDAGPGDVTILFDHKTIGAKDGLDPLPVYVTAGAEIRIQAGMYVDAAVAMGYPMPDLFVYNYLRRPAFDKGARTAPKRAVKPDAKVNSPRWGELPLEYEERLVEIIARDPLEWFHRVILDVAPQLLAESRANVLDTAWEIKQRRARGAWPMNDASCTSYMQPCPWLPVCTGGQSPQDERLYRIKRKQDVKEQVSQ